MLKLPSTALGSKLGISIKLGHPSIGVYTPVTVPSWRTLGLHVLGKGSCVYSAGNASIPAGTFRLQLDSIDAGIPHGELEVLQYALPIMATDCGRGTTETLILTF